MIKLYLAIFLMAATSLNAFTIEERVDMAKGNDWTRFFAPSMNKSHKERAEKIFSVINTPDKKWKIKGTYPADAEDSLVFYMVPTDFDEDICENPPWDEMYEIHFDRFKKPTNIETVWKSVENILSYKPPYVQPEIISQSSDRIIYQKQLKKAKFSNLTGHIYGVLIKKNDLNYRRYEYYQKYELLTEDGKQNVFNKFRDIDLKLN